MMALSFAIVVIAQFAQTSADSIYIYIYIYIFLSLLLHFFRPCGSHVTKSWKILWYSSQENISPQLLFARFREIFATSTCVCTRRAKRAFTAFRGLYWETDPISANMHQNCNNRKWDYCYLFNGKREHQQSNEDTLSHIHILSVGRIVWTVNLGFDITNANFERIDLYFYN